MREYDEENYLANCTAAQQKDINDERHECVGRPQTQKGRVQRGHDKLYYWIPHAYWKLLEGLPRAKPEVNQSVY